MICTPCWRKIENFHTYFVTIKTAQSTLECLKFQKCINDSADETHLNEQTTIKSDSSGGFFENNKNKTAKKITRLSKIVSTEKVVPTEKGEEDKKIRLWCNLYCTKCSQTFGNFSDVKTHYRTVHQENGYVVCCARKYFRRFHLLDHIFKHMNPDAFKYIQHLL